MKLTHTHTPFHNGERQLQASVGALEQMDDIGRRAIRAYMPEQHRQFFQQLPFMILGSTTNEGQLWASILPGKPGFVQSPFPTKLTVNTPILTGDPLASAVKQGARLGLLGLEMPTRRRNRVNATVTGVSNHQLELDVEQSFGNCPQYIQTREIQFVRSPDAPIQAPVIEEFTELSASLTAFIGQADTFFVASSAGQNPQHTVSNGEPTRSTMGVDVSHRGGMPGFIKVQGNTLTIPDYAGNNFFNTLGNFVINPKAGLLFVDFTTGDVFMLTGEVTLLASDSPLIEGFQGALRGWQFTLIRGITLKAALPFRAAFESYSANAKATGTWAQAEAIIKAQAQRNQWRPFIVTKIEDESSTIRSFYLCPSDNVPVLPSSPGQHLTLRIKQPNTDKWLVRNYTVSSAPTGNYYRISVKRECHGQVSSALHANVRVGSEIYIKAPSGHFFIDNKQRRSAVLIGAGVGITPMLSMANDALGEGLRSRYVRPMAVIQAAKDRHQRGFYQELSDIANRSAGRIQYYSVLSDIDAGKPPKPVPSIDYTTQGRINHTLLLGVLNTMGTANSNDATSLFDKDFYLCGPQGFMQSIYDVLIELGVQDKDIHAEAFGPSSLVRQTVDLRARAEQEAESALIIFAQSGIEQSWNRGDKSLLEVAESSGLTPEYSCRNGQCGSCAAKLLSGSVTYRNNPSAHVDESEILLCCAVPAKDSQTIALAL
ncbi:Oxidoreductase FAD-binding region [Paraglaciecola sp. T6c]|uniref:2Fe-2S iron-sulfur cluster-binding protein n=1 Tax=Pseudoalteromonas atlantica (strain T6c / ATCC BAA-1087) TaxID=3042615 RepID=UPI00005C6C7F|nr:pyridoxamine 5'-phosphate oxidase family protein [Paraglaciecola sp. T6c]ABG39653.1 Oxidoreductase FAD-binding region [Paraglaciecola sp. T6c]